MVVSRLVQAARAVADGKTSAKKVARLAGAVTRVCERLARGAPKAITTWGAPTRRHLAPLALARAKQV